MSVGPIQWGWAAGRYHRENGHFACLITAEKGRHVVRNRDVKKWDFSSPRARGSFRSYEMRHKRPGLRTVLIEGLRFAAALVKLVRDLL